MASMSKTKKPKINNAKIRGKPLPESEMLDLANISADDIARADKWATTVLGDQGRAAPSSEDGVTSSDQTSTQEL